MSNSYACIIHIAMTTFPQPYVTGYQLWSAYALIAIQPQIMGALR